MAKKQVGFRGERFTMHEPRDPNNPPPGSEHWPVVEIESLERFTMHEPREPNLKVGSSPVSPVLAAVGRLPELRREVVLLKHVHGLEPTAIADRLGISTQEVADHLKAALERIDRELAAAGG